MNYFSIKIILEIIDHIYDLIIKIYEASKKKKFLRKFFQEEENINKNRLSELMQ